MMLIDMSDIERRLNKKRLEAKKQELIYRNKAYEVRKIEITLELKKIDEEIEINKKEIEKIDKELENYKDVE